MRFEKANFTIDAKLFDDIVTSVQEYGFRPLQDATDNDVDWFVATFLKKKTTINYDISSYTLKHLCERAIGKFRYNGGKTYAYTSNDQMKAAMQRAGYKAYQADKESNNELYNFAFVRGAEAIIEAI